jgi:hypothetical protein
MKPNLDKGVNMGEGDGTVSLLYLHLLYYLTVFQKLGIYVCEGMEDG